MRKIDDERTSSSRSRQRLREATLRLLDERGPHDVTITDVVAAAGVTRPTFYAAFGDLSTAFADAALSRLEDAFDGMTLASNLPEPERAEAMEAAFLSVLQRLERHADFFARVLRGPGGIQVLERVVNFLAERLRNDSPLSPAVSIGPLPATVSSSALAAGITWTTITWLENESRTSPEELATLLRDLVFHTVVGGLGGTTLDLANKEQSHEHHTFHPGNGNDTHPSQPPHAERR